MKVTEKKIVEVVRWTCNVEGHRHQTQEVAQRCIDRHNGEPPNFIKWTDRKRALLVADREGGMTYKELGRLWDISSSRAREVYIRSKRRGF
jgi:hypothetical protein